MVAGYDIIVNAGQSNSSGAGHGPFTESDSSLDSRIFQIGRGPVLKLATRNLEYWKSGPDGTSYDLTLARLFARDYLAPDRNLIVVPAAVGGSSVLEWLGLVTGDAYYANMITRTRFALAQTGQNRIVGWFETQGEADAAAINDPDDPTHSLMSDGDDFYYYKLKYLDRVRSDFGVLPTFFGLFTHGTVSHPGGVQVVAALDRVCASRSMCVTTNTDDLLTNADIGISDNAGHFCSAAQETIATRHFSNFSNLLGQEGFLSPDGAT